MKYRIWEASKQRFRYLEKTLDRSCTAYTPMDLTNERDPEPEREAFSGFTDKNGKEIYQGDIVRAAQGVGQVMVTENGFELFIGGERTALWEATVGLNGRQFEVIGNIHENPELV